MKKSSPPTIAPLLLRNFLTSIFIHADTSFIYLSQKYKFLEFLRYFLTSTFLLFLPSFFPNLNPNSVEPHNPFSRSTKADNYAAGGSGVSRALSQLLLIMNDIPVSSRKYELVRSLAENLINDNLLENNQALTEINCAVLSAAFTRSMGHLEASMVEQGQRCGEEEAVHDNHHYYYYYSNFYKRASRLVRGAKHYYKLLLVSRERECVSSAEKLAAELLWLAQKMEVCGCAEEAVWKWAEAANLASLALSAAPRLQGSLVKVSAFLMKQAKEMGEGKGEEATEKQDIRKIKMKMLISWLPLLCRASNGTDMPVLNTAEKAELERILEEIISTLDEEESEQERVLSLWLHHYTYCPASDWPNLGTSYSRWLTASRLSLLQAT
ncbi:hypothetical protein ACJIZ3_001162 [Penstemon smallii]|uniref:Uncharacterized protein n=1 Tax=Penstemon smallii TaxID=265156 RepID=A0ABD3U2T7_9LAMI